MPEGPEAKILSQDLNSIVTGLKITEIKIKEGSKVNNFDNMMFPYEISKVFSYGKKVIFKLIEGEEGTFYISTSLGMTGGWSFTETKYWQCELVLSNNKSLFFNDTRKFGNLLWCNSDDYVTKVIGSLGPCVVNNLPEEKEWLTLFQKRKRKNICAFLMDQKILSGIGNYIKCDALFLSRISPLRKVGTLSNEEIEKIRISVKDIISESLESNGHTISSYYTINGKRGTYKTKVYGKTEINGYKVIKKKTADQRQTHYVPELQK